MSLRILVAVGLIAIAVRVLLWTTLYQYDRYGPQTVRSNRLTGTRRILAVDGWKAMGSDNNLQHSDVLSPGLQPVPHDQRCRLTGDVAIRHGSFMGKLHNSSNWVVASVIFRVCLFEKGGTVRSERYVRWKRGSASVVEPLQPMETASFNLPLTGEQGFGSFSWSIPWAEGLPAQGTPESEEGVLHKLEKQSPTEDGADTKHAAPRTSEHR